MSLIKPLKKSIRFLFSCIHKIFSSFYCPRFVVERFTGTILEAWRREEQRNTTKRNPCVTLWTAMLHLKPDLRL